MNAIAHAVEGLYAVDGNPIVSLMAEEGIRALAAAQGLYDLAKALGAKLALKDFGMTEQDLDKVADIAAANPYPNPPTIERGAIR